MFKRYVFTMLLVIAALAIAGLGGCSPASVDNNDEQVDAPSQEAPTNATVTEFPVAALRPDQVPAIDENPILDAAHWMEQFPYQTSSFLADRESREKKNYLEIYPFLNTIFAGSRFAEAYYSPLPHDYAVEHVKTTPRLTDGHPAACFSCKTPDYPIMEAADPAAMWSRGFYEVDNQMNSTITCYDCHRNTPGRGVEGDSPFDGGFIGSIRPHLREWDGGIRPATAACAQCHNEYYFDPETRQATLPPGFTDPETIFEYYNSINFDDHVSPNTGTGLLKVQHPEWQHLEGSIHQRRGMTCVDCHTVRSSSDGQGGFMTNHTITTPSANEEVLQSCTSCHRGGTSGVLRLIQETQESSKTRTVALGEDIADFQTRFAAAINAESLNDSQISELQALEREMIWFFDWVFSDNGNGVHNYEGNHRWLSRSEEALGKANALLP